MKKSKYLLLVLIIFALFPLQCEAVVGITDDMGATVTVPDQPQRIISLSPSNTEVLFSLGLEDRVVGVTDFCNYPKTAQDKPRIGGYSTVSIEKVLLQDPDLIVAAYGNGEETVSSLRELNRTVIVLNPVTMDDVMKDIVLAGDATGTSDRARSLVRNLTGRIDQVRTTAGSAARQPRVAHIIWNDPIYVSGNGTFQDEMITLAGGKNAFSYLEGWKNIGVEDFIRADPEVLVVNAGTGMAGSEDSIARFFRDEPRFRDVSAVRDNRIYLVDSDIVDRSGPRIVDALELFAAAIHPELNPTAARPAGDGKSQQSPGFGWTAVAAAGLPGLLAARKVMG